MTTKSTKTGPIFMFVFFVLCFLLFAYLTSVDEQLSVPALQLVVNGIKKIQQLHYGFKDVPHGYSEPKGLLSCGEICSYGERVVNSKNELYPQLQKQVKCKNIMQRMSFRNHTIVFPPPEEPPKEMLDEFTMFGKMPITQKWYIKGEISDDKPAVFGKKQVESFVGNVRNGKNVNVYYRGDCYQEILKKHDNFIKGKRGVVIGTQLPWLEAILLANDAEHVTTLEYRKIIYEDLPKLQAYTPYDFADAYVQGNIEPQFDFAASFSSIEHSGLGRYTDPLNPYGDFEAVAQVWCMVKPGGMFALGVPGDRNDSQSNFIAWNAHRMYGIARLQHLTANWKVVDYTYCAVHHILILIKPIE